MRKTAKTKFVNNIWVSGFHNGVEIMGRTCMFQGKESVSVIDENAVPGIIGYHSVQGIAKVVISNDKTKINPIDALITQSTNYINNN